MYTFAHIATWLIVGLIGGSVVGAIVNRQREGFGVLLNVALGCGGAVLGGLAFDLLKLFPTLDAISISLRDIVAAIVGSFVVLMALWLWRRQAA